MSLIYFAGAADGTGCIKVGLSGNPVERVHALQLSSPLALRLLAVVGGDKDVEHRFHYRYRDYHSHGEWFQRGPMLMSDLRAIIGRTFNPAILPRVDGTVKGSGWWFTRHQIRVLKAEQEQLIAEAWRPDFGPPLTLTNPTKEIPVD